MDNHLCFVSGKGINVLWGILWCMYFVPHAGVDVHVIKFLGPKMLCLRIDLLWIIMTCTVGHITSATATLLLACSP